MLLAMKRFIFTDPVMAISRSKTLGRLRSVAKSGAASLEPGLNSEKVQDLTEHQQTKR